MEIRPVLIIKNQEFGSRPEWDVKTSRVKTTFKSTNKRNTATICVLDSRNFRIRSPSGNKVHYKIIGWGKNAGKRKIITKKTQNQHENKLKIIQLSSKVNKNSSSVLGFIFSMTSKFKKLYISNDRRTVTVWLIIYAVCRNQFTILAYARNFSQGH